MGIDIHVLDFAHDVEAFSRSYGGFGRLRDAIAAAAGFNLRDMIGFGGQRSWTDVPVAALGLSPLLDHSDCDGSMTAYECGMVAVALEPLIQKIVEDERESAERLLVTLKEGANRHGLYFS